MVYFEWTEALDVGIEEINEAHQTLISLMNKLYEQNIVGVERQIQNATLQELRYYTARHFNDEEDYMHSIRFTGIDLHAEKHRQLLEKLDTYIKEFEVSGKPLSDDFFLFLKLWLTAHIQHVDKKYSRKKRV